MRFRKKIVDLKRTCVACPSQWEARTKDDRPVYVRYRWGYLSVMMGKKGESIDDAIINGVQVCGEQFGESMDGLLPYYAMKKLTKKYFKWPKEGGGEDQEMSFFENIAEFIQKLDEETKEDV